jgi:hypothetical protein
MVLSFDGLEFVRRVVARLRFGVAELVRVREVVTTFEVPEVSRLLLPKVLFQKSHDFCYENFWL